MASEESQQVNFEKQVERAKQFKEDLDSGKGWTQRYHVLDEYNSWSKTFPEEEVPVKLLFKFENLPISAEKFAEMLLNFEIRKKWDNAFAGLELLDTFPNGSVIAYTRVEVSFPLTNRDMVLLCSPPAETDWFGKKAYAMFVTDATHASKPAGAHGLIRATNGGNFYIAVPDDEEPGAKCEVFGLSNNNYNGWLPNKCEFLVTPRASKVFYQLRQSIIEGHNKIQVSNVWVIKDDNFFTNKEYEELMTSYTRNQSFDPAVHTSAVLDEYIHEIIEGKDDYLTTDDNYSDFDNSALINERSRTCQIPSRNVLFLKTHYTGGDAVTNILNRFADLRQLLVALPTNGLSSFYWPSKFHWRYLDMQRLEGNLPNVLCNHARYSGDVMAKFMPLNTHFVSMLREPVDYFATVFERLDIAKRMEIDHHKPFEAFALDTKGFLKQAIRKKRFFDSMNLLKNGMFFDLGLHTSEYENEIAISSAIFDLQTKFTLVLIYEYLDESLVLLKRKLCWKIDDIVYLSSLLPRNMAMTFTVSRAAKHAIGKWNMADFMLYDFFNATLWEQIRNEDNFDAELASFKARRKEIEFFCETGQAYDGNVGFNFVNFNETQGFGTRVKVEDICSKMAMTDVDYLEYFRK
ncbi:galactose-3-O-sulfotransferase 2-like [Paramuricea clavata]|uniref:Galactose-3-O-sulfotransferase 2-like n=1 Tax=Paramuricea clavata TaxID=317549 RepID=A0A6S7IV73_PARCT|nr:galactose-3-O-sulfotransferase 2-like [Paramuricea clavata]